MKVLFLDIDGVLCLPQQYGSRFKNGKRFSAFDNWDTKCVRALNDIIKITDCEIVISSDWRELTSLHDMQELFTNRGVVKVPIAYTQIIGQREFEIRNYLVNNKVDAWCAVDDLDLDLACFVKTRELEGIKPPHIKEKIITTLNNLATSLA